MSKLCEVCGSLTHRTHVTFMDLPYVGDHNMAVYDITRVNEALDGIIERSEERVGDIDDDLLSLLRAYKTVIAQFVQDYKFTDAPSKEVMRGNIILKVLTMISRNDFEHLLVELHDVLLGTPVERYYFDFNLMDPQITYCMICDSEIVKVLCKHKEMLHGCTSIEGREVEYAICKDNLVKVPEQYRDLVNVLFSIIDST